MTEANLETNEGKMRQELPSQLKHPNFRFALIPRNKKAPPIEQLWNSVNNYRFFEPKLINHILKGGNVQVITGFGSLIVLDFDCPDYQKEKENLLPKTFTCRTAGKGLKHFYYTLQGDMIKKVGIDFVRCGYCHSEGVYNNVFKNCPMCGIKDFIKHERSSSERLADIQANKYGIVCPPSMINRKFYVVIEDAPIAGIDLETLKKIFNLNYCKKPCDKKYDDVPNPEAVQEALDLFKKLGIPRNGDRHFKCPYHKSVGGHCLWIDPKGSIFCFHCQRHWKNANMFEALWDIENMGEILV